MRQLIIFLELFFLIYIAMGLSSSNATQNREKSFKLIDSQPIDEDGLSASSRNMLEAGQQYQTVTDIQKKRIEELEQRLRKLESRINESQGIEKVDQIAAQSLEGVLEKAKNWVITNIPSTDEECRFDWGTLDCEPACRCSMQVKVGDYNLDRACRLRPKKEIDCENFIRKPSLISKAVSHAVSLTKNQTDMLGQKFDSIAPPTDRECKWNWKKMKCSPSQFCALDFTWGDYSLDRACRFKTDIEEDD